MKLLLVYYSRSGITKRLAEDISTLLKEKNIELQIVEIKDKKKKSGFWGWIKAGRDAFMKKTTEISYDEISFENFDKVLIGTPIWAGRITPAIRTFLEKNKSKFKEIAFFATAGGNKFSDVFSEMENILEKKPLSVVGFQQTIVATKNEAYLNALTQFIDQI